MSHLRIRPLAILLILLVTVYYLISSAVSFSRIFSNPHSGIPLSQSAIKTAYYNHSLEETRGEPVIPRKIHQIYHDWSGKGGNVPHKEQWLRLRDSCINRNPGWQYKLWSSAESREFLQREYPWFLSTYDSYRYPVQRVDAMKYFIMRHEGGIYIDMDNGCLESLEPLRYYPVFVTDNIQATLDNNILGAVPNHPFFEFVTNHIWAYSFFYYPWPYMAIMYNSGQWFFTSMWEKYHDVVAPRSWNPFHRDIPAAAAAKSNNDNQLFRVIMENRRGAEPWVFWNEGAGLTWESWDYGAFMWIGEHAEEVIRMVVGVTIAVSLIIGLIVWRCCCYNRRRKAVKISNGSGGAAGSSLKSVAALLSPVKGKSGGEVYKNDHELA